MGTISLTSFPLHFKIHGIFFYLIAILSQSSVLQVSEILIEFQMQVKPFVFKYFPVTHLTIDLDEDELAYNNCYI